MLVNQERLGELLEYNPETGQFFPKFKRIGVRFGVPCGSINADGYILIGVDRKRYYAHRLAWLYVHGGFAGEIDHINGNRSDNSLKNLRLASSSENKCNARRRSDNKSGFKGVSLHAPNVWRARIKRDGWVTEIGCFSNPEDAHQARAQKLAEVHGEFARIG